MMERQGDEQTMGLGEGQGELPGGDLAGQRAGFWRAGEPLETFPPPPAVEGPSALERLGPSPFPKGKFPFLGLLATIYEHVASHARGRR